jgi:hypothetical protein
MGREVKVTTKDGGEPETYVGLEISGGPRVARLLLTWPYERAAEIVEIPVEEIESVTEVGPHPLGTVPAESA